MKKNITFLLCMAFAVASTAQVKKVVLEDFTGTWCGWCPEGTVVLEGLKTQHGANFFPVASHNGDPLQVADGAAIDNGLNVTAYPNGAVDRFLFTGNTKISMSRGSWASKTSERLNTAAIAAVSFGNPSKKTVGSIDSYYVDVHVKFMSPAKAETPIMVNVYVLEDSIAAIGNLAQGNYSSNVQGGADPLTNWYHNHTLRDALMNAWGDSTIVPKNPTVGTTYTKKVGFTLPTSYVKSQIHLLAFTAYGGTVANNDVQILNSEETRLNYFYPTSIAQNSINSAAIKVYPNPVKQNSMFSINYEMMQDEYLDVNILNTMGQVVATPYNNILDIKGIHTLQINTTNYQLANGMYFVELKTKNGTSLSRFTIN